MLRTNLRFAQTSDKRTRYLKLRRPGKRVESSWALNPFIFRSYLLGAPLKVFELSKYLLSSAALRPCFCYGSSGTKSPQTELVTHLNPASFPPLGMLPQGRAQLQITNANCSAPSLHFVSLRCSVLTLSRTMSLRSICSLARKRASFGIF